MLKRFSYIIYFPFIFKTFTLKVESWDGLGALYPLWSELEEKMKRSFTLMHYSIFYLTRRELFLGWYDLLYAISEIRNFQNIWCVVFIGICYICTGTFKGLFTLYCYKKGFWDFPTHCCSSSFPLRLLSLACQKQKSAKNPPSPLNSNITCEEPLFIKAWSLQNTL